MSIHPPVTVFVLLTSLVAAGLAKADDPPSQTLRLAGDVRPLVSGERVRVKKLTRDIESTIQTLDQGGVAPFQDPGYVQKWQARIEHYRQSLAKYPQTNDPDVQDAAAKLAQLEKMMAFGTKEAAKQESELGDVQAILAAIEQSLRDNPPPAWLPAPFTDEEAQKWARAAAIAEQTARKAIAELQRIAPTAHLPVNQGTVQQGAPYDKQDLRRLSSLANGIVADVGEAVKRTADTLKYQYDAQKEELEYYRELDPDDATHRMKHFLAEEAQERIYSGLDKQLALAESVLAYQRVLGKEPAPHTVARVEEIAALRGAYAKKRIKALGESRLPEPESTDGERLAIAERILAEPRYEFGEHGPVVLTTEDIVVREKEVSRAEVKDVDVSMSGTITLSGTETKWRYKWQEFKFATPLKEPGTDKWYIWWIVAKKFSSGGSRTPIGEWISGSATKGDLILEENF